MAVYEIAAKTRIAATPEDVWAVLDDFGGWPAWMPSMQHVRVELLSIGQPRLGYQFRVRGKLVYADLEVTSYTPLERGTHFRLNFPPLRGDNRCLLTSLEDGGYLMERRDHLYLPSQFISFLNATQRARFEKLAAEFIRALKETAEQRSQNGAFQTQDRSHPTY